MLNTQNQTKGYKMEQCKICKSWLCHGDLKKELPEDSGIYICQECYENPTQENDCHCLYGCDYCLMLEPRVGRN